MQTLVGDCPHCGAEETGFGLFGQTFVKDTNYCWMHCLRCFNPIVARMTHQYGPNSPMPDVMAITPTYNGWTIAEAWPEAPRPNLPDFLPDKVAKALWQAEDNFRREGMEDPAAGSYGRALDIATKLMAPDFKGMLFQRIEHLAKEGRITKDLATWAHEIRSVRNNALHEVEGIDREELTAVRGLTDMVLRYLFTLPGMLKTRKDEAKAAK